jgi:hypothetical protein
MRNVGIVQTMPSSSRSPQKLGWSACASTSTTAIALSSSKRGSCPNRNVRIPAPAHIPLRHTQVPPRKQPPNASESTSLWTGGLGRLQSRLKFSQLSRGCRGALQGVHYKLVRQWHEGMLAYGGAQQANGQEGKTPALNTQRMQRAYIGRIQGPCAHACMSHHSPKQKARRASHFN